MNHPARHNRSRHRKQLSGVKSTATAPATSKPVHKKQVKSLERRRTKVTNQTKSWLGSVMLKVANHNK